MSSNIKSNIKSSIKSLTGTKFSNNDTKTNLAIFLMVALTVGYLVNKQYEALVFLLVIAGGGYFFCKNLFCALAISIILTNLLLSLNYFKVSENFKERVDKKKKKVGFKEKMLPKVHPLKNKVKTA